MKNLTVRGVVSTIIALTMLLSGAGVVFAQTSTSTHNHGHGNGYNNNGNNSNHNNGVNGGSTYNNGNGNNTQSNYRGTYWGNRNGRFFFTYGGHQYYGIDTLYVGRAYNVMPNSFMLSIGGQLYPVYYSTGYQLWNNGYGYIGPTAIISGDTVRVDGVYMNGVIYATTVRDISR